MVDIFDKQNAQLMIENIRTVNRVFTEAFLSRCEHYIAIVLEVTTGRRITVVYSIFTLTSPTDHIYNIFIFPA